MYVSTQKCCITYELRLCIIYEYVHVRSHGVRHGQKSGGASINKLKRVLLENLSVTHHGIKINHFTFIQLSHRLSVRVA